MASIEARVAIQIGFEHVLGFERVRTGDMFRGWEQQRWADTRCVGCDAAAGGRCCAGRLFLVREDLFSWWGLLLSILKTGSISAIARRQ